MSITSYEGGYADNALQVRFFWSVVKSFSPVDRALLITFLRGSSRLPHNGFRDLSFIIRRDAGGVERLPTAHTCEFSLELPQYASIQDLEAKLRRAMVEETFFRFMFGSFRAKLTPHDFTSNTGSIVGQLSGGDAGHVFGVTKIRGGSMYATYTIQRMTVRIPYSQFVGSPGTSVLVWRRLSLPAAALAQMRSLCRFRCGQLVLRHLDNKVSSARCQACIFCGATVRNAMVHCLSSCPHWSNFRNALRSALSRPSEDNVGDSAFNERGKSCCSGCGCIWSDLRNGGSRWLSVTCQYRAIRSQNADLASAATIAKRPLWW
jgi:hypothetical protein